MSTDPDKFDLEEFAKQSGFGSLEEMAEFHKAYQAQVEKTIKSGTSGMMPCKTCQSDAAWERDGRDWNVECETCGWGAAGCIPQSEVPVTVN